MKSTFVLIKLCIFLMVTTHAQNVGIGTTTPNANAALEIKSNTKGLLMPRLSTTARNNITNVAKGMLVYDTTRAGFYYHDGGKWLPISQSNSDSLLSYTYPGVAPTILSMPLNSSDYIDDLYGTLYDNGGLAGNYASNSNDEVKLSTLGNDSAVLFKVEVVQMNLESPYDSLEIYSENDYEHKQVFTGNRTGTFYFTTNELLYFKFRSNGVNNLSGFKINWTVISTNSQTAEPPPLTGWYFNSAKVAARAGVNSNNNWATVNLGKYSFAVGQNAIAKGDHSNAIGNNSAALEYGSTSIGINNIASGRWATAIGFDNIASNAFATAMGRENIASGDYAHIIGALNVASGSASTAIGRRGKAIGNFSTVIGIENHAIGNYSTAIGNFSRAGGSYSSVLGLQLVSRNNFSMVVGLSNDTTAINSIFEIGNGQNIIGGSRSNAVTVLLNGNTGLGTTAPTTTLDVDGGIRTKYSGSVIKSVTGTGSAALVNLSIPALPGGWDLTNTLVLVSLADGTSGIIYRTKLTSTTNIELFFEANATGVTRFNYIVFKL